MARCQANSKLELGGVRCEARWGTGGWALACEAAHRTNWAKVAPPCHNRTTQVGGHGGRGGRKESVLGSPLSWQPRADVVGRRVLRRHTRTCVVVGDWRARAGGRLANSGAGPEHGHDVELTLTHATWGGQRSSTGQRPAAADHG
jgi:hypothetical protein